MALKDKIYSDIFSGLIKGKYVPGDVLNEQSLVAEYGCSKTPIREALISLCNKGILRCIPRFGYEILAVSRSDVEKMMTLRYIIEINYLKLNFATICQPNNIKMLSEISQKMSICRNDAWTRWDCNTEFHMYMMEVSGDQYASNELRVLLENLKLAYGQLYMKELGAEGALSSGPVHHEAILNALERNDLESAVSALRTDLIFFGDCPLTIPEIL